MNDDHKSDIERRTEAAIEDLRNILNSPEHKAREALYDRVTQQAQALLAGKFPLVYMPKKPHKH